MTVQLPRPFCDKFSRAIRFLSSVCEHQIGHSEGFEV